MIYRSFRYRSQIKSWGIWNMYEGSFKWGGIHLACTAQIAKPVHCWSFILSELVAGVPRGAQNFGYVCTGPSFYVFYSEKAIKLFVRLNATLYFLSPSYKTFKSGKTATDFRPQAYLAGLECLYWFGFWMVST